MKRILYVSGFSGFVGKNIFHYFFNDPFVKCAELNLREPLSGMAFAKQSAVLHLAGKAHDLRSTQDEKAYYKVNYDFITMSPGVYVLWVKSKDDAKVIKFIVE